MKITIDNKLVNSQSVEVDDIEGQDYPDFSNAFATYAEFEDGTELTERQLEKLTDEYIGEIIHEHLLYV